MKTKNTKKRKFPKKKENFQKTCSPIAYIWKKIWQKNKHARTLFHAEIKGTFRKKIWQKNKHARTLFHAEIKGTLRKKDKTQRAQLFSLLSNCEISTLKNDMISSLQEVDVASIKSEEWPMTHMQGYAAVLNTPATPEKQTKLEKCHSRLSMFP
jgi:hypothetical protein